MVGGKHFGERFFNGFTIALMILLMIVTMYPFWFSIISSFNSGEDLLREPVFLWPREFTAASWKAVLNDPGILHAAGITALRTVIVTVFSMLYTSMFAYAFSRPYLKRKGFYATIGFISMYFSGGLIPSYMLMNWLGIYDTFWVYILPSLFGGFWNVIIFNANFKSIPEALFESAKMDGASEYRIFFQIVLPLSKPVLAALSVFTAVGVWNDYGATLYFTQSPDLQTLQYVILRLIQSNRAVENMMGSANGVNLAVQSLINQTGGVGAVTARTVELAAMVIASLPMILMYPFAQKFFVKGVLLGSVKG
ncbi:putative aldouronate transport system permease protein [Paenibacillus cellulosilyticus]|uniref:Putative aldouronate transport system permease protein n=1 Tax=Paenibacillus cellulosilyticus TaxID=375489 RepID=A0A2V2YTC1_9BACL|nr:carbohydrate ABC transporter permease [Paenibacillus cellulosilyticus]PWW02557.1 putative aldouronate transport system permease protein [Paenibacillus cellulosilyticus]QKS47249.1 carbohydrate ABC transporter permease [Paenibacillus cellulosilyticus]